MMMVRKEKKSILHITIIIQINTTAPAEQAPEEPEEAVQNPEEELHPLTYPQIHYNIPEVISNVIDYCLCGDDIQIGDPIRYISIKIL